MSYEAFLNSNYVSRSTRSEIFWNTVGIYVFLKTSLNSFSPTWPTSALCYSSLPLSSLIKNKINNFWPKSYLVFCHILHLIIHIFLLLIHHQILLSDYWDFYPLPKWKYFILTYWIVKYDSTIFSDCNWTRTQNYLVLKRTLNHLAKLAS